MRFHRVFFACLVFASLVFTCVAACQAPSTPASAENAPKKAAPAKTSGEAKTNTSEPGSSAPDGPKPAAKAEPGEASKTAGTPGTAPKPAPAPVAYPDRLTSKGRVVAIGDTHGDMKGLVAALLLAGVVDGESGTLVDGYLANGAPQWTGGTTTVVLTGDVLDRGDDEKEMLDLLARLSVSANEAGGRVVMLLGNHEIMNAQGDLRYVTEGGYEDFVGYEPSDVLAPIVDSLPPEKAVPDALLGRLAAFFPGGEYAKQLANYRLMVVVDDTLFLHGGLSSAWAEKGLETMNAETQAWLKGASSEIPLVLKASDGPIWHRDFIDGPDEADCADARKALELVNAKRMVVGHTHVDAVGPRCDGLVWGLDVGLAKYYGGEAQVLEIENGVPTPRK